MLWSTPMVCFGRQCPFSKSRARSHWWFTLVSHACCALVNPVGVVTLRRRRCDGITSHLRVHACTHAVIVKGRCKNLPTSDSRTALLFPGTTGPILFAFPLCLLLDSCRVFFQKLLLFHLVRPQHPLKPCRSCAETST